MIAWLTDTFIYTTLLIALVLVLRRPVAQQFGPQTAYSLWALPLLRLVMPPIVLPASFAPAAAMPVTTVVPAGTAPTAAAFGPAAETSSFPWIALVLMAWMFGAALFLAWRCWSYFAMRRDLLAHSRPVGEAGTIRMVETPALVAPVAFGVFDKVVALPMEFMALEDRAARDLAIAHELAHHRGRDLLANMLAQPLLALHWFNPLAWAGWRAMRRDQEAACDARVIACRTTAERAHYGRVIASFAAGPRLALAAPMACPMAGRFRGEKSIIHRLRSLNMCEISPRRRLAGRALWVAGALALPLTASISYAVAPPPEAPEAPATPNAPPAAEAPATPEAPTVPGEQRYVWRTYGGRHGDKEITTIVRDIPSGTAVVNVGKDAHGKPVVQSYNIVGPIPPVPPMPPVPPAPISEEQQRQFEQMGQQFAAQGQQWAQWGERFGKQFGPEWAKEWQNNARKWQREAQQQAREWQKKWQGKGRTVALAVAAPDVRISCGNGTVAVATDGPAGVRSAVTCRQRARDASRHAIERAKANIANNANLSDDAREAAIDSLDVQLDQLDQADDNDADVLDAADDTDSDN